MQVIIPKAIKERRLLRLIYDGRSRTVEPHTLGLIDGKCEAMLCWQISPPVRSGEQWHIFHLDKISGLRTLEDQFEYAPNRPAPIEVFSEIHATQSSVDPQSAVGAANCDAEMPLTADSPQQALAASRTGV